MADAIYRRFRAEGQPAFARLEGTAFAVAAADRDDSALALLAAPSPSCLDFY